MSDQHTASIQNPDTTTIKDVEQLGTFAALASLGYVLIEMLAGVPPFDGRTSYRELLEAKRFLAQKLPYILPEEVVSSDLLMSILQQLIATHPDRRLPSAEAADLVKEGAAAFHRQLIKGDLASEYDSEIRLWLEELEDI